MLIIIFLPLSPAATQKEYTSKTENDSLLLLSVRRTVLFHVNIGVIIKFITAIMN